MENFIFAGPFRYASSVKMFNTVVQLGLRLSLFPQDIRMLLLCCFLFALVAADIEELAPVPSFSVMWFVATE